jgi:hypothetical protein
VPFSSKKHPSSPVDVSTPVATPPAACAEAANQLKIPGLPE